MATETAIALEEYLQTSYEGVDREYVDGEVVERAMPDLFHSRVQQAFATIFGPLIQSKGIEALAELRVRLAEDRVRIPDYCVFAERQTERFPSTPPLVAVEIVSLDDLYSTLIQKLGEYHAWGVRHVWLVDPYQKRLSVFDQHGLRSVEKYELPALGLTIEPGDLFD